MSVGINDARFASMMHTCALYSDCPEEGIGPAASKMQDDAGRADAPS